MKIVILGGAGAMAEVALDELAKEAGVEKVTIADYNAAAAGEKAKKYGEKFDSVFIDATKPETITSLVKNYDVAMGFIGPFYQFEAKIAKACIDAGTHYVSISDDYDAYLAVEKLFDEAKKAGVTVISGLGNSPGITNILAKKAYYSMDKPEKINIHWTGGSDETVGAANVKHVMHIFEGHTLQWMDGKEVWVKTGEGEKVVEFPQPIGVNTVFYTGHAESVSVPRNLKGLKEVTLHGGTKPVWISRFATVMGKLRLTDTPKKRQTLAQLFEPVLGLFATGGVDKSVFRIDVYGTNKGVPRHNYYTGVGHIAFITSIPCVEGALMLAKGEIKKRGVFAAEAILDHEDFLARIAKRGVELFYYEGKPQE